MTFCNVDHQGAPCPTRTYAAEEWARLTDPLTVDEEPWTLEDPLAPARGIATGLLLGLAMWALLGVVVWLVWKP